MTVKLKQNAFTDSLHEAVQTLRVKQLPTDYPVQDRVLHAAICARLLLGTSKVLICFCHHDLEVSFCSIIYGYACGTFRRYILSMGGKLYESEGCE